jgi:hypothetical protein
LISESVKSNTVSTDQALSTAVQSETILHLSDVACATLKNQEFIDSIIPLISEKVMLLIKPKIAKIVDECMQPHLETIQHNKDALILQEIQNKEQKDQISSMKSKINNLEKRLEEQKQYSRRRLTNVKVPTNGNNVKVPTNGNNVKVPTNGHNVKVPTNGNNVKVPTNGNNVKVPTNGNNVKVPTNGNNVVKTPIDADSLVLGICKKQLGVELNITDIGKSHPIGEICDDKISIIVRFLTYRQRQMVFTKKKELKDHVDKTFMSEHLTRHRYDLLKRLNTLRVGRKIHSFWTPDGSVLVKETERSRPIVAKSRQEEG